MLKVVRKLKVDWVLKDSAHAHITGSCSIGLSVGAISGFITVPAYPDIRAEPRGPWTSLFVSLHQRAAYLLLSERIE